MHLLEFITNKLFLSIHNIYTVYLWQLRYTSDITNAKFEG